MAVGWCCGGTCGCLVLTAIALFIFLFVYGGPDGDRQCSWSPTDWRMNVEYTAKIRAMEARISKIDDPVADAWGERNADLRGVNVGGWLLMERFIVGGAPTLRTACCGTVASPYADTACQAVPTELAVTERLRSEGRLDVIDTFRDAYVSREDFKGFAEAGLNAVRVPFGYWIVGADIVPDSGFHTGKGLEYLDRAVGWAEEFDLKVVLDLHGAPGSQNGRQTSGDEDPQWTPASFQVNATLETLRRVAARYAGRKAVIALELINEPELPINTTVDFYKAAIPVVRSAGMAAEDVAVVINLFDESGILAIPDYNHVIHPPAYENVAYDLHLYYAFLPEPFRLLSLCFVTRTLVRLQSLLLDVTGRYTFTGEWSLRLVEPGSPLGDEYAALNASQERSVLRSFANNQIDGITGQGRHGGFYWTWEMSPNNTVEVRRVRAGASAHCWHDPQAAAAPWSPNAHNAPTIAQGPGCVTGNQTYWSLRLALERGWIAPGEWAVD